MNNNLFARSLFGLGIDNGGRVISQSRNYDGGKYYGFDSWQISDGSHVLVGADFPAYSEVWRPVSDGSIYDVANHVYKYDSNFSLVFDRNINDYATAIPNQTIYARGSASLNSTETVFGAAFGRLINGGLTPQVSTGAAFFSSGGDFLFLIEEDLRNWPVHDGSGAGFYEAMQDTAGNIFLFASGQATRTNEYGVDHGNVWVYSSDGDFLRAINAPGLQPVSRYTGILGSLLVGIRTESSGNLISVKTFSVSTGAVVNTVDLSDFGNQIYLLRVDRVGNIYALVATGSQKRMKVVCLDSSLNLKWSFFENESLDSVSGNTLYPIMFLNGVQCSDDYVVIGGGEKLKRFDASQLVVYQ